MGHGCSVAKLESKPNFMMPWSELLSVVYGAWGATAPEKCRTGGGSEEWGQGRPRTIKEAIKSKKSKKASQLTHKHGKVRCSCSSVLESKSVCGAGK